MIIDGKKIAQNILDDIKSKISKINGKKPTLSVILVGDNPASHTYVRTKKRICEKIGITSSVIQYDDKVTEQTLLDEIRSLNEDINIDAILIQMPLPKHINTKNIIEAIDPNKDVDGFHPLNVGKTLIGDDDTFLSCTPNGIKTLLQKSNIDIEGKHVVIVGRSNIVGKPLAAMLMQKKPGCNASVTVIHSYSKNFKEITRSADILVAAIGKAKFITKDMVKESCVIIDVGINHIKLDDGTSKIVGDVDFDNLFNFVSYITPVPGGIGPMTIAMLMQNTLKAFDKQL